MKPIELKIARIRAGLRQKELAALVGIDPANLSRYEAGTRQPAPELLERIIKAIEGNSSPSPDPEEDGGQR